MSNKFYVMLLMAICSCWLQASSAPDSSRREKSSIPPLNMEAIHLQMRKDSMACRESLSPKLAELQQKLDAATSEKEFQALSQKISAFEEQNFDKLIDGYNAIIAAMSEKARSKNWQERQIPLPFFVQDGNEDGSLALVLPVGPRDSVVALCGGEDGIRPFPFRVATSKSASSSRSSTPSQGEM